MNFEVSGNIWQTQNGPLHLIVSKTVQLIQETYVGSRAISSALFVGNLKITNGKNHLITFTVISAGTDEVIVRPFNGVLDSYETQTVVISAKGMSSQFRYASFRIVVLATTCEVRDFNAITTTELSSFWKKIMRDSKSFVDIETVTHFLFTDWKGGTNFVTYESAYESGKGYSNASGKIIDSSTESFSPDSCSSIGATGSQSEGSEDSVGRRKLGIQEILKRTKDYVLINCTRRNHAILRRNVFTTLLIIFVVFRTLQSMLTSLEFNIVVRFQR